MRAKNTNTRAIIMKNAKGAGEREYSCCLRIIFCSPLVLDLRAFTVKVLHLLESNSRYYLATVVFHVIEIRELESFISN